MRGLSKNLRPKPQVSTHQRGNLHLGRRGNVIKAHPADHDRVVGAHRVLRGRGMPLHHEVAHGTHLATGRLFGAVLHGNRHTSGDIRVVAAIQVGQNPRPHQQHHRAVAVIAPHHGPTHLHQLRPQRVEPADIEFRCAVESSGRDSPRRRKHPVAAHHIAGDVLAY
ncbi:Uncharacterised protein [Mycobacteroides abscessus subsp. abscessus]|nr:Uncharacterised protein [Mycobacteroides abscessus subsp. abscessus]